ncbi:MAG: cyclase family protein [Nocardioidaceae bacterium]|nr:cyclase family protein [Nocardioidaceae bacterium]NUS52752.1 cyclase family protein [Nocardioidaceae bacterium]
MRVQRVVDLSVPVDAGTVVYPGDPVPRFEVHSTIHGEGFNLLEVHLGSQSGTHVDAPYHFEEDGLRIDEVPVERFVGPGVVVDATDLPARGEITLAHVEPVADRIGPGVVVLLRTGWSEHYGSAAYFEHPYLGAEACRRMLDLGARTFCIDAINIDETPDDEHPGAGFPCHHLISRLDGVIGENFRLGDLPDGEFLVACTPIRLTGADGGPVRAVAIQLGA